VLLVSETFGGGAAPSAGLNFFSHATGRRHTARYPAAVKKRLLILIGWSFPHDLWNGAGACYRHDPLVVFEAYQRTKRMPNYSVAGGEQETNKVKDMQGLRYAASILSCLISIFWVAKTLPRLKSSRTCGP
jgi:hypothetical protein